MKMDRLVVRVEHGVMRRMPAGMALVANAWLHRRIGEPEIRELPRLVAKGSIAVDVGAHFGTYSYPLSRLVGNRGQVMSIEPVAEDAARLELAAHQLRLPIRVYPCALSSCSGTAELLVPDLYGRQKTALSSLESHESAGEKRTVQTRRLDDLLESSDKPVSFIKIDVEGHELAVLQGAVETIRRHKPNLLIEIDHRFHPDSGPTTFQKVTSLGYHGEFLNATGQRRPISEFDPDVHQHPSHDVLSPEYIGNFIFTPV
jgi:FkbM family methyltransferase